MMVQYDEVFPEVRQRVAAFKYWQEFWKGRVEKSSYGDAPEGDYLDDAYRFLFTSASKDFMEFCAKKEGMSFDEYCYMLGVCVEDLIGGGVDSWIKDLRKARKVVEQANFSDIADYCVARREEKINA